MTGRRNLYNSKVDFRFVAMLIPFGGFFVFLGYKKAFYFIGRKNPTKKVQKKMSCNFNCRV